MQFKLHFLYSQRTVDSREYTRTPLMLCTAAPMTKMR